MRKTAMIALLATGLVAAPALADQDRDGPRRGGRSEARDDSRRSDAPRERPARRAERNEDDSSSARTAPAPEPRRSEVAAPRELPAPRTIETPRNVEASRDAGAPRNVDAPRERRGAGDSVREWRIRDRTRPDSPTVVQERNLATPELPVVVDRRSIEERNLREPRVRDGAVNDRPVRTTPGIGDRRVRRLGRNVPVEGSAPPPVDQAAAERGRTAHRWRGDWRRDGRYDWRRHRDRHRSIFRLGFYFDPFGWGYRRYNVGWRLWPDYYRSSYWLNDPWMYRLPPAYGPYRWIRYHDDALLVNTYTGEVVDVLYSFFW